MSQTRNPFRGKGLAVSLALLLDPAKRWSLGELAAVAEVSRPLASMVVRRLRTLGLVVGEVSQGRVASVRPTAELFWETARQWPPASVFVLGGVVPTDRPTGGGPVAAASLGVMWQAPPRAYLRSPEDIPKVLARSGGVLVGEQAADWELAVVDFPFPAGPVPSIVSALELGTTPRGREMLDKRLQQVLDPFVGEGAA